jgi:hypothetical protein
MATQAVSPQKSHSEEERDRKAAFVDEMVEFARERLEAMSREQLDEACTKLKALNEAHQ